MEAVPDLRAQMKFCPIGVYTFRPVRVKFDRGTVHKSLLRDYEFRKNGAVTEIVCFGAEMSSSLNLPCLFYGMA